MMASCTLSFFMISLESYVAMALGQQCAVGLVQMDMFAMDKGTVADSTLYDPVAACEGEWDTPSKDEGDSCDSIDSCGGCPILEGYLTCMWDTKTCLPLKDDGEPCSTKSECKSGACNPNTKKCGLILQGDTIQSCMKCDGHGWPYELENCVPLSFEHRACATFVCKDGECAPEPCDGPTEWNSALNMTTSVWCPERAKCGDEDVCTDPSWVSMDAPYIVCSERKNTDPKCSISECCVGKKARTGKGGKGGKGVTGR